MKILPLSVLLTFFVLLISCSNDETIIGASNTSINSLPKLTILNDINEFGDFAVIKDTSNYTIWRKCSDLKLIAQGYFNGDTVVMQSDSVNRPIIINCNGFNMNMLYCDDTTFIFCKYADCIYNDTIFLAKSPITRTVITSDVVTALCGWVTTDLVKKGIEKVFNHPIVKPIYNLLDYQRATIDMGLSEELNYQIEQYNYLDWLLRPSIDNMPIDWVKRLFEEWRNKNIEQIRNVPTITIGLLTGDIAFVYGKSAVCYVDGYLHATANNGTFDFDYGLCYSENKQPTIADFVVSKNIRSKDLINDITLTLPEKFTLSDLKEHTKYYYRAFFKDNITGVISYCEIIRNFTTYESPISINKYEVEENPIYENGNIHFNLYVYLKGDEEELKRVKQFGYYIRHSSSVPDYQPIPYSHLSLLPETPLKYELNINKNHFSEENKNYLTFEATAIEYYIGAYVILENENIIHIDEQPIDELVYKEKPIFEYLNSNIIGTEIDSTTIDNDGNQIIYYKTTLQNQVSISGSFWIEYIEWQCEGGNWNKISGDNWYIENDGIYNTTHHSIYTNKSKNLTHSVFYIMHLTNGNSLRSNNHLIVSGNETITNVSISGGSIIRLSKSSATMKKQIYNNASYNNSNCSQ